MKYLDPFKIDLEHSTLIEASAGTGKTYTITTLYCRLVAQGYPVESILVVTFTEAAAAELKIRIRERISNTLKCLGQANGSDDDDLTEFLRRNQDQDIIRLRLRVALSSFDQASVMTIHSFCLKILKENAFESRLLFDIELVPDRSGFLHQVCSDFFMARINSLDPLFLDFLHRKSFTPESVSKFFEGVLGRQGIRAIPDVPEFADLSDQYRTLVKRIKRIILNERDQIHDLIAGHKGIDKRSFSKKHLPNWIDKVCLKFEKEGDKAFFIMKAKKDPLYNFTNTNIAVKTKKGTPPTHEFFDLCEELADIYNGFEQNLIRLKTDFISFFDSELEKLKKTRGICFFDDLVNDLAHALDGKDGQDLKSAVRQVFSACLIDEFQDTDSGQYKIFSTIFAESGTPFFMVGDPKQAIYGFRGGDIFTYLEAAGSCDQAATLKKNYRSSPLLVKGVNSVFADRDNPFLFDTISFTEVDTPGDAKNLLVHENCPVKPLRFCFVERNGLDLDKGYIKKAAAKRMVPSVVAGDILNLMNSEMKLADKSKPGKAAELINPGDIAVLVRTNEQASQIQTALAALNIPSYLSKTGSVFESDQALELYDILWAIQSPDNRGYIKSALATSVFGFTSDDMIMLDQETESFHDWQRLFAGYKKEWEAKGFVSMIMSVFCSKDAFLKAGPLLDERGMTNFYHLIELISRAFSKEKMSPYYLLKWYLNQLSRDFRDVTADELRLSTDKKAVAIVTIHKSKGLEYPVVYFPYLWEDPKVQNNAVLFHDPGSKNQLTIDLGSDDIDESKEYFDYEQRAEQRRLLYVALTRASAMCKIIWGGFKSVENSALGSLFHPCGCKNDETMLADLEHQQSLATQSISIEKYQERASVDSYNVKGMEDADNLKHSTIKRTIKTMWKMSSFSAIAREMEISDKGHDPVLESNNIVLDGAERITLADFPKGAGSGDFFHYVFENMDFTSHAKEVCSGVEAAAGRFGILDKQLVITAGQAVQEVLQTPLCSENGCITLNSIKNEKRFNELEFAFPVEKFNVDAVAKVLQQHDPVLASSGYPEALGHLRTEDFSGFVKGFIDLIVEVKGKWYIIDYKTNYLGEKYFDYCQDNISQAMSDHHYFLQYYFYLIALHRYLNLRIKDYDYDKHFGGVFYLFIRGMHPDNPSDLGVYSHRPPKDCICMLSQSLSD